MPCGIVYSKCIQLLNYKAGQDFYLRLFVRFRERRNGQVGEDVQGSDARSSQPDMLYPK